MYTRSKGSTEYTKVSDEQKNKWFKLEYTTDNTDYTKATYKSIPNYDPNNLPTPPPTAIRVTLSNDPEVLKTFSLNNFAETLMFDFKFTTPKLDVLNKLAEQTKTNKFYGMHRSHLDLDTELSKSSTDSNMLTLNLNIGSDVRFIHYNTKKSFEEDLNKNDTELLNPKTDIIFIDDTGEIFTHNNYYTFDTGDISKILNTPAFTQSIKSIVNEVLADGKYLRE